jgi:hypothetical protein
VLKLLIMLEISLIVVIYKKIGKFWYITQSELNSCKWRYFHSKSSRGYLSPYHSVVFTILQSERNFFLEKGLLSYMF